MAFDVLIKPLAEIDIKQSVSWYEDAKPGLGIEFYRIILAAINKAREKPNIFPKVNSRLHKISIRKFPFCVFYELENQKNRIVVHAVFHNKRHPKNWKDRR
jgi:plasmid stabilization system protein ParE